MTSPGSGSDSRSLRERLSVGSLPPTLPSMVHIVINSMQQKELARRYGQASTIIPNVIDFETPPPELDEYSRDFRQQIGVTPDDILVLQPTRLVPARASNTP